MTAVTTTSINYERLKEIFPEQTHLTPADVARVLKLAIDTVRRAVKDGRLNAGFTKLGTGSLRVSMKAFADYLDGLPVMDGQQSVIAYEPKAGTHFDVKNMPARRGAGGVRSLEVYQPLGFEHAHAYSGLDMLAVSGRFEGSYELQSLLLKFGIWLYRLGHGISHKDIQELSAHVESLTTSLDDVEACSKAFFASVLVEFNKDVGSDNLESLLSLALYFSEYLPKRFVEV